MLLAMGLTRRAGGREGGGHFAGSSFRVVAGALGCFEPPAWRLRRGSSKVPFM